MMKLARDTITMRIGHPVPAVLMTVPGFRGRLVVNDANDLLDVPLLPHGGFTQISNAIAAGFRVIVEPTRTDSGSKALRAANGLARSEQKLLALARSFSDPVRLMNEADRVRRAHAARERWLTDARPPSPKSEMFA